jgi:hypothetical protein
MKCNVIGAILSPHYNDNPSCAAGKAFELTIRQTGIAMRKVTSGEPMVTEEGAIPHLK